MGVGLAALGRPGYINLGHATDLHGVTASASMEAAAHAVLDSSWDAGVRYFDAARSYGRAEEFLGRWLTTRKIAPDQIVVGSKWGYTYTADWQVQADKHEVKDLSLPTLLRQELESRQLLGSHLKLYQIHSATLESGVLTDQAVLAELARLRHAGLRIGLSLTGPRQSDTLRAALDVTIDGERLFDCVQATWNLLEQSAGLALADAHAAGMGVIVKESLANGRLTDRNDDPAFRTKRDLLTATAAKVSVSIDALALAAVLAQPWADVVLSGAATVEQLRSNLKAFAVQTHACIPELVASLAESAHDYWTMRSQMPWN